MWKRELLKNKLYALLLVGLSLPIMFLDGDATATVLMLFFAVPMFFAKENWIMGGTYATQESRRKSVRRCTYRSGEKAMDLEIQRELAEYDRKHIADMRWRTRMIFGSVPRC